MRKLVQYDETGRQFIAEVEDKEYKQLMEYAKKNCIYGIYAIEKDGITEIINREVIVDELSKDYIDKDEVLKSYVSEYKSQGFKVYTHKYTGKTPERLPYTLFMNCLKDFIHGNKSIAECADELHVTETTVRNRFNDVMTGKELLPFNLYFELEGEEFAETIRNYNQGD